MATLLYVDDEALIGKAVARWFSRRGHTVHLAVDIATAQQAIAEHEPDALFIDVWLGSESGFELMSWIEDTRPALAGREGAAKWRRPRHPIESNAGPNFHRG